MKAYQIEYDGQHQASEETLAEALRVVADLLDGQIVGAAQYPLDSERVEIRRCDGSGIIVRIPLAGEPVPHADAERQRSPMTAPQETLELPEPLAGQSLGAAPCSATVEKPHKVHVWVCGRYCGPYEFATAEEADADYEYRQGFRVLGCYYKRESPNAPHGANGGRETLK